ncbi:MAG: hypothetical protein PsegKO_35860 [Pseudohongiellaceae bacterium]
MSLTTFDTLKFVRRLEQAGVPSRQAEVLTEAFNVNLDTLVTKDYLAAQFAEQKAAVDARFAAQNASVETRFAEQNAYIDTRFAQQQAYMDVRFAQIDSRLRFLTWTQAIVIAAVVIPLLERLAALSA